MARMQQRRATAADFMAANPILNAGEPGYEIDSKVFKVGDGVTHWNDLQLAYIPASIIEAAGDMVVMAAGVELLTNSTLSTDSDSDGLADNWVLYGDSAAATIEFGGQRLNPAPSATSSISEAVPVVAGRTYTFSCQYTTRDLTGGQVVFKVEWYSDAGATVLITYNYDTDNVSNHTATYTNDRTAPAEAIQCRVSLSVEGGGDVVFNEVGFSDESAEFISRLARGATGQTLVVKSDGTLGWDDTAIQGYPSYTVDDGGYIPVDAMISFFSTKADAEAFFPTAETNAHMDATYERIAAATTAHAALESISTASSLGESIDEMFAKYESLDLVIVKVVSDYANSTTTVFVADSELKFNIVAGGIYEFEMLLFISGTPVGDIQVAIHGPDDMFCQWGVHGASEYDDGSGSPVGGNIAAKAGGGTGSNANPASFSTYNYIQFAVMKGIIIATSDGVAGLSFLQVTPTGAAHSSVGLFILPDSYLKVMQINTSEPRPPVDKLPYMDDFDRMDGPVGNEWRFYTSTGQLPPSLDTGVVNSFGSNSWEMRQDMIGIPNTLELYVGAPPAAGENFHIFCGTAGNSLLNWTGVSASCGGSGEWRIWTWVAGTATQQVLTANGMATTGNMRFQKSGDYYNLFINDDFIVGWHDSGHISNFGSIVALYSAVASGLYDNFAASVTERFTAAAHFIDNFDRADGTLDLPWYYNEETTKLEIRSNVLRSVAGGGGAGSILLDLPSTDFEMDFDWNPGPVMGIIFNAAVGVAHLPSFAIFQINFGVDGNSTFYHWDTSTGYTVIDYVPDNYFTITSPVHVKLKVVAGTMELTIGARTWTKTFSVIPGQSTISFVPNSTAMSIDNLVIDSPPLPLLPFSDNFNRTNGVVGNNWVDASSGSSNCPTEISSNQIMPSISGKGNTLLRDLGVSVGYQVSATFVGSDPYHVVMVSSKLDQSHYVYANVTNGSSTVTVDGTDHVIGGSGIGTGTVRVVVSNTALVTVYFKPSSSAEVTIGSYQLTSGEIANLGTYSGVGTYQQIIDDFVAS